MFVRGVSHKTYWLEGAETGCSALRLLAEKEAVPTEVLLQQNGKFVEDWDQRLMPVTLHVLQKGSNIYYTILHIFLHIFYMNLLINFLQFNMQCDLNKIEVSKNNMIID